MSAGPPGPAPADAANREPRHPVPAWVWHTAIAIVLAFLVWEAFPLRADDSNARDWEFFYPAAQALLEGTDLYESGEKDGYIYPPLLAFAMMPLVGLGFIGSAQVWLGLSALAFVAALFLTAREVSARLGGDWSPARVSGAAFVGMLLSINFARREFEHTQTDWITVLAFVLGLMWAQRKPLLAGAALGIAANLKYHTLIVIPYLLLRGKPKAAGATAAFAVLAALLPAVYTGWSRNLDYLARAFGGIAQFMGINVPRRANVWELSSLDSISVTSALARLSESLGHGTGLTLALVAVAASGCVGLAWWMYRRHGVDFWNLQIGGGASAPPGPLVHAAEWMGLIIATIAFSPQTLKRHMFVAVPVFVMAAVILIARPRRPGATTAATLRAKAPMLLGTIAALLALSLPIRTQTIETASDSWRAVGGPSLGLLVLFFALLWTALSWERGAQPPAENSSNARHASAP